MITASRNSVLCLRAQSAPAQLSTALFWPQAANGMERPTEGRVTMPKKTESRSQVGPTGVVG